MQLDDLLDKTCLIGLSYFNVQGELMKQSQLAGRVVKADEESGISVELQTTQRGSDKDKDQKPAVFILPPTLKCWFIAPQMHFTSEASGIDLENPDYLVTWDIHQTRDDTAEGEHEWWDWIPREVPPQVQ